MNESVLSNHPEWERAERGARRVFGPAATISGGQPGLGISLTFDNSGEQAHARAIGIIPDGARDQRGISLRYASGGLSGRAEFLIVNGRPDITRPRFPDAPGGTLPADHPERQFAQRIMQGMVDAEMVTPPRPAQPRSGNDRREQRHYIAPTGAIGV